MAKRTRTHSFKHCSERALERYGIKLTPETYEIWNNLCDDNNCTQVDNYNGRTLQTVHDIQWGTRELTVVMKHNNNGTYLSTVLPQKGKLKHASRI